MLSLAPAQEEAKAAPSKPAPGKTGPPKTGTSTFPKKEAASTEEVKRSEEERQKKYEDPATTKFPYAALNGQFPAGVDPTRKEAYLADEEFETVLGMSPAAFAELKKWKQNDIKKAKALF